MLTALRRLAARAASDTVHALWRRLREAAAVTADRPGPYAFHHLGERTRLAFPQGTVFGERYISLGARCVVGQDVTLTVGMAPGLDLGPGLRLTLGDGVVLGRGSHIVADAPVDVADDVFLGPYCYVTSTNHSYDDPARPVGLQWPRAAPVAIGAGSWIGAGAVVLPGARLGRNVVVAAGAVVRGEIPDHTVVAGVPARAVRRWSAEQGWQPPLRTPAPVPWTGPPPEK